MAKHLLLYKGTILALVSATLWGLSGTVAQALFSNPSITTEWFVVIRLLISGALLFGLASMHPEARKQIWSIWKNPKDRISLILFGIIGMLGVQYTYLTAIAKSNAAVATFLQYLAPLFVVAAYSFMQRRWPRMMELIGVLLAIGGTFFLITGGKEGMNITLQAFFWGLASAICLACYTLQPVSLLKRYESVVIVSWGMLIGGIVFSFVHPPWETNAQFNFKSILYMSFIILFGTVFSFFCYIESMKQITPSEASLFASMEPLAATIASVVWLKVPFGIGEWFGAFLILLMVFILTISREQEVHYKKISR